MNKQKLPKTHPRYQSLLYRERLVEGIKKGLVSLHGLIAHGRGETFDYLLGEKTQPFAKKSIETACALLLLAKHPVISVNGNTAALVPQELVKLAKLTNAFLEVNLFHASKKREKKIKNYLLKNGAKEVLLPDQTKIPGIESNRQMINQKGQAQADVIFIPLEDGDRAQALAKMGKKVIACDLNPLSRTAQTAHITIVDNILRTMPLLIKTVKKFKKYNLGKLSLLVKEYNNQKILAESLICIYQRLKNLAEKKVIS